MDRSDIENRLCESIEKHCPAIGADKKAVQSMVGHILVSYDHAHASLGIKSNTKELAKLEKYLKLAKDALRALPPNLKERLNYEIPFRDDEKPRSLEEQVTDELLKLEKSGLIEAGPKNTSTQKSATSRTFSLSVKAPQSPTANLGMLTRRSEQVASLLEGASRLLNSEEKLLPPVPKTDYVAAAVANACRKVWAYSTGNRAPRQIQNARFEQPLRLFIKEVFYALNIDREPHGAMERAKRITDEYIEQLEAFWKRIEEAEDMAALQTIRNDLKATNCLFKDLDLSGYDTDDFTALTFHDAKRLLTDCLDLPEDHPDDQRVFQLGIIRG